MSVALQDVTIQDDPWAPCLYATGRADMLLHGLNAILLHQRIEHGTRVASGSTEIAPSRAALCHALMELAHNWPEIVAGSNRFHTASMIAADIDAVLSRSFDPVQHHDEFLRSRLAALGRALRSNA